MLARFLSRVAERLGRAPAPLVVPVAPPRPPFPFVALADSLSGLIEREGRELAHLEELEARPRQQGQAQGLEWPILDLRRTLAAAREAEALLRALAPHEVQARALSEIPATVRPVVMRPTHANDDLVALHRAPGAWQLPCRVRVYAPGETPPIRFVTVPGKLPR